MGGGKRRGERLERSSGNGFIHHCTFPPFFLAWQRATDVGENGNKNYFQQGIRSDFYLNPFEAKLVLRIEVSKSLENFWNFGRAFFLRQSEFTFWFSFFFGTLISIEGSFSLHRYSSMCFRSFLVILFSSRHRPWLIECKVYSENSVFFLLDVNVSRSMLHLFEIANNSCNVTFCFGVIIQQRKIGFQNSSRFLILSFVNLLVRQYYLTTNKTTVKNELSIIKMRNWRKFRCH